MPVHVVEKLNKIGRIERKLLGELGREATVDEIAEELELEADEIEHIKRSAWAPISLRSLSGTRRSRSSGTSSPMRAPRHPTRRPRRPCARRRSPGSYKTLSLRERRVLEMRYGLDGQHPRTLDEVGRTFSVTRERVRQIENQCLKKLQALAETRSSATSPDPGRFGPGP